MTELFCLYAGYLVLCLAFWLVSVHSADSLRRHAAVGIVLPFAPIMAFAYIVAQLTLELAGLMFRFDPPSVPSPFEWFRAVFCRPKIDRVNC